jgi:hypothetical protein
MRSEELKVKNQESRMDTDKFLEQYLSGKAPLHANRLKLPTEEELDEAEAAFDERVGSLPEEKEQKRNVFPLYWKGIGGGLIAASIVLLLFFRFTQNPEGSETISQEQLYARLYPSQQEREWHMASTPSFEKTVAEIEQSGKQLQLAIAEMQQ